LAWYRRSARDLPWRRTRDPYAIWVSEIMLQQTQVITVERYFPRFLAAFPSIAALADGTENHVLRLWEGLGYYRRARQMHVAAKQIVALHDGQFPQDFEAACSLPGIGRYTAGAILSIAFDARQPILEANTIRLLSRLLAFPGNPASANGQALLWAAAESLLAQRGHGELNQSLMELGSQICTPRNPQCDTCPLKLLCPTRKLGLQNEIPATRPRQITENVREVAVIVQRRGKVLLRQCGDGQRWAGLWDFPRFKLNGGKGGRRKSEGGNHVNIVDRVRQMTGIAVGEPKHFTTLRHSVTRFRITLDCFVAHCDTLESRSSRSGFRNGSSELRWINPADFDNFPLSVTGRKLARLWLQNIRKD
jgi:A/G-specific adenine glycosylase